MNNKDRVRKASNHHHIVFKIVMRSLVLVDVAEVFRGKTKLTEKPQNYLTMFRRGTLQNVGHALVTKNGPLAKDNL